MKHDVHQLRGIKLREMRRDPVYFLGKELAAKIDKRHMEECFDFDTLFYDVFFDSTNKWIIAAGPPLGNLQLDVEIYVNGKPIKLRTVTPPSLYSMYLVKGRVRNVKPPNEVLIKVEWIRGRQQWELKVPINNTGAKSRFTLCALNKDNREHWIKDWIEHYRKLGVDRVIIYDNDSRQLPEVDAIVIPAPYKYGLNKYIRVYKSSLIWRVGFLQRSLLTICSYKYRSGHLLNFDIDELLQTNDLERYKRCKTVYFRPYWIGAKTNKKLPENYSFKSFTHRHTDRQTYTPYDIKYIVAMKEVLFLKMHRCTLVQKLYVRVVCEVLYKLGLHRTRKWVKKWLEVKEKGSHSRECFYHYRAINTGWKFPERSISANNDSKQ